MKNYNIKDKIKACVTILIIVLAIVLTGIITIKYQVEGEKNMPFTLSKITIMSTAEGIEREGSTEKWNLALYQNNDIYFSIEKNEGSQEAIIESVIIENIEIVKLPSIGTVKTYMPNSSDGRLFSYSEEYILEENKLTFAGATKSNSKTLEIGNQGGTAVIRFSNIDIGEYISDEDEEVIHNGTILKKVTENIEDIEFEVKFDLVINLGDKKYKSNISLTLPCANLLEEGISRKEISGEENFVFKRVIN